MGIIVYTRKIQEEIHLLLGVDTAACLFTERIEHFPGLEIAAFETKLGWTLMGRLNSENKKIDSSLSVLSLSLHISDGKFSDLWRLDAIGILNEDDKTKSILEEVTRKHFLEIVKWESDGRYEVTLPRIVDNSVLSCNRYMAEKSLYKTEAKLI
ncbi:integrase catalytic domain-containing protein [Nephila pilipes]|uniref:Integrase catalytic domain-containing protein n=1 Tax=Nephila pilipes TaxID=299642 RepID=A0A8X6NU69_NEPPI|nr:integrase catalytic domain-containing protein [Nephila pilipes]